MSAEGNLFISDTFNAVVREVSAAGTITTFAGNGTPGFSGDGGAALGASLDRPETLFIAPGGALYIYDLGSYRVREIGSSGLISTIAGNGGANYGGDGGPATSALFAKPGAVAVRSDGTVFLADSENNRIRQISSEGIVSDFAGDGTGALAGNGGPAVSAEFNFPSGIAIGPGGDVYVADTYNSQIRRITADGVVTAFVGTGQPGYSGDGGAGDERTARLSRSSENWFRRNRLHRRHRK